MKILEKQLPNHPVDKIKRIGKFIVEISEDGYVTVYDDGDIRLDLSAKPGRLEKYLKRLEQPEHLSALNERLARMYHHIVFNKKSNSIKDYEGQIFRVMGLDNTENSVGIDNAMHGYEHITVISFRTTSNLADADNGFTYHIQDLEYEGENFYDLIYGNRRETRTRPSPQAVERPQNTVRRRRGTTNERESSGHWFETERPRERRSLAAELSESIRRDLENLDQQEDTQEEENRPREQNAPTSDAEEYIRQMRDMQRGTSSLQGIVGYFDSPGSSIRYTFDDEGNAIRCDSQGNIISDDSDSNDEDDGMLRPGDLEF